MESQPGTVPPNRLSDNDIDELTLRAMVRSTRLIRQVMEPFFVHLGISLSQWVVMRIMLTYEEETGGPVRMADLCSKLMIRQPTLTGVINRLVLGGLVNRVSRSQPGRGRFVSLSPEGRALMNEAVEKHRVDIQGLFRVWNDDEKGRILELFERLENHLMETIGHNPQSGRCPADGKGNIFRGKS